MPVVRVIIPTALRQYAANHDAVEVEAASVEQALGDLEANSTNSGVICTQRTGGFEIS